MGVQAMKSMLALSIKQPWAWAILYAGKDIENRDWPTRVRGRIVVHAGKTYDQRGHDWLISQGYHVPADLPRGCNLGEVDIVGCHELAATDCTRRVALNPWAFGDHCFELADPVPYDVPILQTGALKFFKVEVPE